VLPVGQCGAYGRWGTVTDAVGAMSADEMVVLVEIPQAERPLAHKGYIGNQRPVFVAELVPDLSRQARSAHRSGVPPGRGGVEIPVAVACPLGGVPGSALLDGALAIGRDQLPARFD